jgi:gamma-glutamylcysteine synthetase
MVAKFRTSLALQPIATALFANSPFIEGKPSGFLSARANVWTDVDPDRTGMLDFVFADGFGFEAYARYALDVPMYFVKRDGRYVDVSGRSFRQFMDRGFDDRPGDRPSLKDWADHATTIFPEVRLKQYLEMRGADSGPWSLLCALPALWTGVLYDDAALAAAWDLCKAWTTEDHDAVRRDVARRGLKAEVAGRPVRDVARDMLAIARAGLKARNRLSGGLVDETGYLSELQEIAASGITPAERLLELYNGAWAGDVSRVFEDFADHLTTAFPEVRLKQYLEMRGADGGPWNRLCALPAFWVGLLYDDEALDAAWDLVKDFSREERHALRDGVPKHALKLPFRGGNVRDLAEETLKIAAHGLKRRARLNKNGADESIFLEPLIEIVQANQTPAERKLELFHGAWNGSVDPVFREFAY